MKILIVEDEVVAAERLAKLVLQLEPSAEIMAMPGSIRESVSWLMKNQADLIFLDIQLSDGLSFSIFDQIQVNTPVIFTTAYDQYAIRAFQLNSIAYLLKPVRQDELQAALLKLQQLKSAFHIDFESLIGQLRGQPETHKKRFLIQYGDKLRKVEVAEIAYFWAQDKSVFMRLHNGQTFPSEHTLDQLENLLDPSLFFRINRKYLASMAAIGQMVAYSRGRVKLQLTPAPTDPDPVIVSIERASGFKQWIDS